MHLLHKLRAVLDVYQQKLSTPTMTNPIHYEQKFKKFQIMFSYNHNTTLYRTDC